MNSLEEFPEEKPSSTFHHPRASNSSSDVDEHSLSNNQECNFCNFEQPSDLRMYCLGCEKIICPNCTKVEQLCSDCYKYEINHMVKLFEELRLYRRFWNSIGIGFFLQIPFSASILLDEIGLLKLTPIFNDIIMYTFLMICGVFFIGYPGFLRYICKVQPNDERADELEQMEAIYGKLSDITKEINGDTERSLGFIQEESKLPNKIL